MHKTNKFLHPVSACFLNISSIVQPRNEIGSLFTEFVGRFLNVISNEVLRPLKFLTEVVDYNVFRRPQVHAITMIRMNICVLEHNIRSRTRIKQRPIRNKCPIIQI